MNIFKIGVAITVLTVDVGLYINYRRAAIIAQKMPVKLGNLHLPTEKELTP